MKSKFAILIRMISIIVFSAQMITAEENGSFWGGFAGKYGNNEQDQKEFEDKKYVIEDIQAIFDKSPGVLGQKRFGERAKDISTLVNFTNDYFIAIHQLLEIEYPAKWQKGNENSIDDMFMDSVWEYNAQKKPHYTAQDIKILSEKINVGNIQHPWTFFREQIELRKKICESLYPNDDWRTLLTKVQMDIQRQNRKSWFRTWYLTNFQNDLNFQKSSPELRDFIFKNYLEIPANGYGTDEANCLLNWKENSGLQEFLDSEDCQQRPWYVADQFFQFMNLERFQKCKEYGDLCKFLPKNSSELGWNRGFLRNDQYTEKISLAVKNWLILKFGYSEDSPELQDRDLPQLLALLRENFEAVRPYHRFLYDQIQDEEVKKFLNYFIN